MRPFPRASGAPAEVRAAVAGRVLAAAESADGSWLAGTRAALHAVGPDGSVHRWPWERVQRADWVQDTGTLTVVPVEDYGAPVVAHSFELREPGLLLQLVRERVTASVVLQRRVDLDRRGGFTVIARRAPSASGEVAWAFEFDAGVDPDDPAVAAAAEAALQEAQQSLGL